MRFLLHISDIHLGTTNDAKQYSVQLTTDLKNELKIPQLDYIVISGDIANKSEPDEYKSAVTLVNDLLGCFSLSSDRLIIVPGNHDLNWDLSRQAYHQLISREKLSGITDDAYIPINKNDILLRNDELYKKRFSNFTEHFYNKVYENSVYPLNYDEQGIVHEYPDDQILFLALNSNWQTDHYYKDRAGIFKPSFFNALGQIQDSKYDDWLKIAVCHHPVTGKEMIQDDFLEQLAVQGFQILMHGHIHRAGQGFYRYDPNRPVHIIGAGTFGAPAIQQVTGIPLQYNLLKLDKNNHQIIVETRKKEKPAGAWMADAIYGDRNNPEPRYKIQLRTVQAWLREKLHNQIISPGPPELAWSDKIRDIDGVGSLEKVFLEDNLPDRVFSVELLTEPIVLERQNNQVTATINRNGVSLGVYTTMAKKRIVEKCFNLEQDSPEAIQKEIRKVADDSGQNPEISHALDYEKKIHDFLLLKETSSDELILDLEKFPLRWASGGVLPVVTYRGKTYSLFFFRDIAPCGWNIPLGASDRKDNLQRPWDFMWREFLEELLVLSCNPSFKINKNDHTMAQEEIEYRQIRFESDPDLYPPTKRADEFTENHVRLREKYDNLSLIRNDCNSLELKLPKPGEKETNLILKIQSGKNKDLNEVTYHNLLMAINPLEIGIEIVAVVKFDIGPKDYFLDGEILNPENIDSELVRMPMALISHAYLREIFTGDWDLWDNSRNDAFNIGYDIPAHILDVPLIPENEIVIFDWDIRRRRAILNAGKGQGNELKRYRKWAKEFWRFAELSGDKNMTAPPALFTPTSAKIMSYYFSQKTANR